MSGTVLLPRFIFACVLGIAVIAIGCGGYSSPSNNNTGSGTIPSISDLAPSSVAAGSAAFTLTVNGSGFGNDAVVYWNGNPRSTTRVSGNQLTAAIAPADVAAKATIPVTVLGGGYTSNAVSFTVN